MNDSHTDDDNLTRAAEAAAEVISGSSYLVAFTGAGISVESGIPPFRGPDGIWNRYDPRSLELEYFDAHPEDSWIVIKEIFYDFFGSAEPNQAHLILAQWQNRGVLKSLITQNIDDLHTRAGSPDVIEYHGNSRLLRCLACRARHPAVPTLLERLPPACPVCGGLLKPDFVFFGEGIPAEAAYAAEYAAENADAMILIGTTGEVYPAAMLPERAKANGAAVIEINPNRSNYTGPITDIFLKTGAVEGIRLINEELRRRGIV